MAESYHDIGDVYKHKSDLQQALANFQLSLQILQNISGGNHYKVADALHSIGLLYEAEGQVSDAYKTCQQALELRRNSLSADHPKTRESMVTVERLRKAKQSKYASVVSKASTVWSIS